MMSDLTHFDADGKAHMVNVGDKPVTDRVAVAQGTIPMAAGRAASMASFSWCRALAARLQIRMGACIQCASCM